MLSYSACFLAAVFELSWSGFTAAQEFTPSSWQPCFDWEWLFSWLEDMQMNTQMNRACSGRWVDSGTPCFRERGPQDFRNGEGRYQACLWRLGQPKTLFISISKGGAVTKAKEPFYVFSSSWFMLYPSWCSLHFSLHLPPCWQSFFSFEMQHQLIFTSLRTVSDKQQPCRCSEA